jgi:hypothetical protein
MKKIIFSLIALVCMVSLSAQNQGATWWYFGNGTGLDFTKVNNGTATVPTKVSGPIKTSEGCFAISDHRGDLIMTSDGQTIYGPDKKVMVNGTGLLGHASSAQSGIVIPRPKTPDQYYVVTVSAWKPDEGSVKGIHYSVVDMTKNGGKGQVMEKNTRLNLSGTGLANTETYENIMSVGHSNGTDYWLVHRTRGYFVAWLVTQYGIGPAPTKVSSAGFDPGKPAIGNDVSPGNLKISPDGDLILHAGWHGMTIGNFNTTTGAVTSARFRNTKGAATYSNQTYSAEFSPNGQYVFYNNKQLLATTGSYWATQPAIEISKNWTDALQLGPDNKIYCFDSKTAKKGQLWVINNPNDGGNNVSTYDNFFTKTEMSGPTGITTQRVFNFPTFGVSLLRLMHLGGESNPCINTSNQYALWLDPGTGKERLEKVVWDWGDGSTPQTIYYYEGTWIEPSYTYRKTGSFTIKVTPYKKGGIAVTSQVVTRAVSVKLCSTDTPPTISLTGSSSPCAGTAETYTANVTMGTGDKALDYLVWDWGDGKTDYTIPAKAGANTESHVYSSSGVFTIKVIAVQNDGGRSIYATKTVSVKACVIDVKPTASVSGNFNPCAGEEQTYVLSFTVGGGSTVLHRIAISWGDGTYSFTKEGVTSSDSPSIFKHTYTSPGSYPAYAFLWDAKNNTIGDTWIQIITVKDCKPPITTIKLNRNVRSRPKK